ncbi:unnamed protein product [Nippostrongylus brasiliensis]|uniref:Uncharacterized protein n=1 Tax=Nippostrongylus brasiliensis TaxID=27835 RepID=A0A0N4YHL9_NIPBR|nr:unnamed protein product [Nippostrongylus brasiliensis]
MMSRFKSVPQVTEDVVVVEDDEIEYFSMKRRMEVDGCCREKASNEMGYVDDRPTTAFSSWWWWWWWLTSVGGASHIATVQGRPLKTTKNRRVNVRGEDEWREGPIPVTGKH